MELKITQERIIPQTRTILSHQNRNFNTLKTRITHHLAHHQQLWTKAARRQAQPVVNRVARHVPVPCVETTSIDESLAGLTEADRQAVSLKTFALPQFLELR